jgi:hypothetical protein
VTSTRAPTTTTVAGPWRDRVDAVDWDSVRGELDRYGCALTGPLLTADEAAEIAGLYPDVARFRSTVDMRRHRFGEGEYRYFAEPFPDAVAALKQALYPRLLPIARDWWTLWVPRTVSRSLITHVTACWPEHHRPRQAQHDRRCGLRTVRMWVSPAAGRPDPPSD